MSFSEHVLKALLAFVNARNLDESRRVVEDRREELLSEAADQIFQELLEQYRDNPLATQILREHQTLLSRCRREGIEAAFAGPSRVSSLADISPALLEKLKLVRSPQELKKLVQEHPELLPNLAHHTGQKVRASAHSDDYLQDLIVGLEGLTSLHDMPRRVELCSKAIALVKQESDPKLWAKLQGELANSLIENPLGDRGANLEQAIFHFQQSLKVYTRQNLPEEWAVTMTNLGIAYRGRILGDRAANMARAIYFYQQAPEVFTRTAFPMNWALTQNNLGNAYRDQIAEDWSARPKRASGSGELRST
jgi:hypothetical protein